MSGDDEARRVRWREIERIYWLACEREGTARQDVLQHACADDADLRQAVEALLAMDDSSSSFLEGSGIEVAADLLAASGDATMVGRRVGPYVIGAYIGSGGMGDVYRATDGHLQRDVALKVLPPLVDDDDGRLSRLTREAQILASLNHQNIAAIYGFEQGDGVRALVLELVEGPTLADLVAERRPDPDEVMAIARQIAEGLEAAHERGIVHRDLKPSNVAVRPDGVVKLLDFGIATVLRESSREIGRAAPSLTEDGQAIGGIAATAAYASPEQLRGRATDRRTDIWSFGAVLYELLVGRPAFAGVSTSDTMTSVLHDEIDFSMLPVETPPPLRQLIGRCLTRDPRQRLQDIGEARIALDADHLRPLPSIAAPASPPWTLRRVFPFVLLATLVGLVAAGTAWRLTPSPKGAVTRFTLTLPEGQVLSLANGRRPIAVSPDGRQIVYAGIPAGLYRRELAQREAVLIEGSDGLGRVSEPAFSPDGRSIAFHADGAIRTIPIAGGTPAVITKADAPYGMNWGPEGIVFGQGAKGIMRAPPDGGTAELLVRVAPEEEAHGPQILPGGHHLLFTLASGKSGDRWDKARIVTQPLPAGERTVIIADGSDARYLTNGHLLYAREGTLYDVPFNPRRFAAEGPPRPVLEGVSRSSGGETGSAAFALSQSGVLAYVAAPRASSASRGEVFRLGLIDRRGTITALALPADTYQTPRVSPDGTKVAFVTEDANEAIVWIWDLSGKTARRRLTFSGHNRFPIWSPDGTRIAFQSDREGDAALFVQPAAGSGAASRLTHAARGVVHAPQSWAPDGRTLLVTIAEGTATTLATLSLTDGRMTPFAGVPSAGNISAAFSPDGKWIAYGAGARGRPRIYVQPVPAHGGIFQLESGNDMASHPVWMRDGRELVFNPGLRGLGVVAITFAPAFGFGEPGLLPRPFRLSPPEQERAFDVMPDGRFLARIAVDDTYDATHAGTKIQVVLNWPEEWPHD
jgi:serine/threonine protein kinase/Tol biopolymer transport system component